MLYKKVLSLFMCSFFFMGVVHSDCVTKTSDLGGLLDFRNCDKISEGLFLLTTPRSGTNFFQVTLQHLIKMPIRLRNQCFMDPDQCKILNFVNEDLDFTKLTLYTGHEIRLLSKINPKNNKLIMILRDYKENLSTMLYRRLKEKSKSITYNDIDFGTLVLEEILQKKGFEYFDRLSLLDKWKNKTKLLVFYEDLVKNPKEVFSKVLSFLGEDCDICNEFDFEMLRELVLSTYRPQPPVGSVTEGKDLQFYSNLMGIDMASEINRVVSIKYPKLWSKYLSRYAQ